MIAVLIFLIGSSTASAQKQSVNEMAGNLLKIARVKDKCGCKKDGPEEKRFRFILTKLRSTCSDTPPLPGDKIAVIYKEFDKAGLGKKEGLVALTENIFQLTTAVVNIHRAQKMKCSELWAAYTHLRTNGAMASAEAKKGLIQIYRAARR